MPKLKRKTSHVSDDAIYTMYDGPEPRPGVYPGVITNCYMSKSGNGNMMFNLTGVLETKGVEDKEKYDGWRGRGRIVLVDKEANLAREKTFYRALGVSEDPDIVYDKLDEEDRNSGHVSKIGNKNPVGQKVKFQVVQDNRGPEYGMVIDMVLPLAGGKSSKKSSDEEEEEELEDDETVDEEGEGVPDLKSMTLAELRALAKEKGVKATKKADIIDELTDWYADNTDSDEDEDEDEDDGFDEDDEEDEEETGYISTVDANSRSLKDLFEYATSNGVKRKKIEGMKKGALVKFLTNEGLISDEPPF